MTISLTTSAFVAGGRYSFCTATGNPGLTNLRGQDGREDRSDNLPVRVQGMGVGHVHLESRWRPQMSLRADAARFTLQRTVNLGYSAVHGDECLRSVSAEETRAQNQLASREGKTFLSPEAKGRAKVVERRRGFGDAGREIFLRRRELVVTQRNHPSDRRSCWHEISTLPSDDLLI